MHTRFLPRLAALVAAAMLLDGCAAIHRLFRPRRDVRPDVIGVVLPLTGRYEPVGRALLDGIQLAMRGAKVKLEVRDSQGEPERALQALEDLAQNQKAIAVLGGVISAEASALGRRADEIGIPLLTFSKQEHITSSGSFTFRNMTTIAAQAKAMARFSTCELGLKSFAVLGPDEANARLLTEVFSDAARDQGAKVEPPVVYPPEQTTFTKEARKLSGRDELDQRPDFVARRKEILQAQSDPFRRRKALEKARAALPSIVGFQALFLPDIWKTVSLIAPALAVEDVVTNSCDEEDMRRVRATTGRKALPTVTLLGWGGWQSPENQDGKPELLARGGKFMHCAYYVDGFFAGSARPATRRFVQSFRAAYGGKTPNLLHAYAFDSAQMYRRVLEESAPADSDRFKRLLADLPEHDGAAGPTTFDSDREARKPLFFLQITEEGVREVPVRGRCAQPTAAAKEREGWVVPRRG
jgi:branched-chain amino acid transport system substrate-binding protein